MTQLIPLAGLIPRVIPVSSYILDIASSRPLENVATCAEMFSERMKKGVKRFGCTCDENSSPRVGYF